MKATRYPKIMMDPAAYDRMFAYARAASGEITGFGTVEERNGDFFISEVYIMPQVAGGAHVRIDGHDMLDFQRWCREDGSPGRIEKARFWWHSHVDFGVFRSHTDEGTCDLLQSMMPYLICTVVNKRGEHRTSFHQSGPVPITLDFLKLERAYYSKAALESEVAAEVKEYVQSASYQPVKQQAFVAPFQGSKGIPITEKPAPEVRDTWDRYGKREETPAMSDEEWKTFMNRNFSAGVEDPSVVETSDEEIKKIILPEDF